MVNYPPAKARDLRDTGSIPGLGRSTGGGHGNPLQYSCLEHLKDRGGWRATVHGVSTESDMTETTWQVHTDRALGRHWRLISMVVPLSKEKTKRKSLH